MIFFQLQSILFIKRDDYLISVAYSSQGSHTGQLDFCNWLADGQSFLIRSATSQSRCYPIVLDGPRSRPIPHFEICASAGDRTRDMITWDSLHKSLAFHMFCVILFSNSVTFIFLWWSSSKIRAVRLLHPLYEFKPSLFPSFNVHAILLHNTLSSLITRFKACIELILLTIDAKLTLRNLDWYWFIAIFLA